MLLPTSSLVISVVRGLGLPMNGSSFDSFAEICFEVVSNDVVNCVRFCNVSTSFIMNNEILQRFSVDKFNCLVHFGVVIVTFIYF